VHKKLDVRLDPRETTARIFTAPPLTMTEYTGAGLYLGRYDTHETFILNLEAAQGITDSLRVSPAKLLK
jgi:hypothetical protein